MARNDELVSGYEIAKALNKKLQERDGEAFKAVQPQMIYQYIRNNRIASVTVKNSKGEDTKMVDPKVAATWIKSYLAGETGGGRRSTDENVAKLLDLLG